MAGADADLNMRVQEADRLRDAGRTREAADAYARALDLAPHRTDLRVQRANMLKDSGAAAQALDEYRLALDAEPDQADTWLQLGHAQKLLGRLDEALNAYRQALAHDPELEPARREMALLGDAGAQVERVERARVHGETGGLIGLVARLESLSREIAALKADLPDLTTLTALPPEAYGELRRLHDIPPPSSNQTPSPRIAVILDADCASPAGLEGLLCDLFDQRHAAWTLTAFGPSSRAEAIIRRAAATDRRVAWRQPPAAADPGGFEHELAVTLDADLVLLLAQDARLHPTALAWIAWTWAETGAEACSFDEERFDPATPTALVRLIPRQPPDRHALMTAPTLGESLAATPRLLAALAPPPAGEPRAVRRSRLALDLVTRGAVAHIPLPLIARPEGADAEASAAHRRALEFVFGDQPDLIVEPAPWRPDLTRIRPRHVPADTLSVIVPTRDNLGDLERFIASLLAQAAQPDALEIVVVENAAGDQVSEVLGAFATPARLRRLGAAEPFNWSRLNNLAAATCDSQILVFANDDMCVLSRDWDAELRLALADPEVGAVGALLVYPDGLIQHAGMITGWRGATIHDGWRRVANDPGPAFRWATPRAVSAVTGAFLAVRRTEFLALGGFDALRLPVGYSDVDLAFRLRAQGRKILWTPAIRVEHAESKSRGLDHLDPAKEARAAQERQVMAARWGEALKTDPGVSPVWATLGLPLQLLALPSAARAQAYIRKSARSDLWRIAPPQAAHAAMD
ncbi:MAG: glycosyltransferase [Alphaproteobacteria bacterium]|nr:glycosyltransferase [Alphaproteobacteria bacterium]